MKHKGFELGEKVKCKITGFKGTLTTITYHINGCVQMGITPKVDKDGKFPDSVDVDYQTLEKIGTKKKIASSDTGGSPRIRKANIRGRLR